MRTGGGGCHIEHVVHKLLITVTKFPVLLKTAVLKELYLVRA